MCRSSVHEQYAAQVRSGADAGIAIGDLFLVGVHLHPYILAVTNGLQELCVTHQDWHVPGNNFVGISSPLPG